MIRYSLVLYVQSFAILLSGIAFSAKRNCEATAIVGASVLIVIVFTPWEKKLFWNLKCVWVNWELYAELTGELSSDDRCDNEEMVYPLLVEVTSIPVVMFGSYFGIAERWVEKSDPRIQRIIEAQTVLSFNSGRR